MKFREKYALVKVVMLWSIALQVAVWASFALCAAGWMQPVLWRWLLLYYVSGFAFVIAFAVYDDMKPWKALQEDR